MFAKSALKTTTFAGALAVAAGFATIATPGLSGTAEAASQPNYARYCARVHPGSFVNRLRGSGTYICTKRGNYSLLHYRINLSRACYLTTGNSRFRNFGRGYVLCGNRAVVRRPVPRRSRIVQRTPNLRAYCARIHPGSFLNRFRRTGEYICTKRGNYSLLHYRINMARACYISWRTTSFRYLFGQRSNPRCLVRTA